MCRIHPPATQGSSWCTYHAICIFAGPFRVLLCLAREKAQRFFSPTATCRLFAFCAHDLVPVRNRVLMALYEIQRPLGIRASSNVLRTFATMVTNHCATLFLTLLQRQIPGSVSHRCDQRRGLSARELARHAKQAPGTLKECWV